MADDSDGELHRLRTPVVDELFGMKPPHMCFFFFVDSKTAFYMLLVPFYVFTELSEIKHLKEAF